MHAIGSDLSEYPVVALAISIIVATALGFAWKEYLAESTEPRGRLRHVFEAVGIWSVSVVVSAVSAFNIYRLFHPPHDGRHQLPSFGVVIFFALPLSVLAIFGGAFSSGMKRVVVVISSGVMAVVTFLTILDNINW